MNYEAVIGLEVHVQIKARSKVFSRVATGYGHEPNTLTDPVVLALPGALPVMNKAALDAIIKAGLLKVRGSDEEVQAAMDQAALRELPRLEKRTAYLGMLGNVSTLLGLLGTILGLIKCFASVAGVGAAEKATLLAEGISEAMNCTAFGIFTAIVALIGFAVFQGKTQSLLDDINESTVRVLNLVVENRDKMKLQAS